MLWEKDVADGVNIGLIDTNVRYILDRGYDVVLEGILNAQRYGDTLRRLTADHAGLTLHYYFDIPFEETVRRHGTRDMPGVSAGMMREWYRERDLLVGVEQQVVGVGSSVGETVGRIVGDLGVMGCGAVPLEG